MKQDVVTAIERSGRHNVLVTINEEIQLMLSRDIWAERPLSEGEELDFAEFSQWLLPRQYPEALNKAVVLLAQRARSGGEIRQKLERAHYLEDTIDMVLYKLEKERLLDDEAFAREFAASCARRQMGKSRIRMELVRKGLPRELIDRTMEELPQEEADDAAIRLAQKLLRRHNGEDTRKEMQKVLAAMARRGYSYEDSKEAIEAALQMEENEAL
ncbi:MAG: regulatory protein RecX [Clostridia bacterium]|nr:regulatory protein RecX [Clostridia bacterium]